MGDKKGIVNSSQISVTGGQRTGAAIKSINTYGPGSFELSIKLPQMNGICTAFWLFNYFNEGGGEANNYEIDIEVHGSTDKNEGNYKTPLFTNWITETKYQSKYHRLSYSLADGKFHNLRIDWRTGDSPRVEYYIDGVLCQVHTNYVPTNEMYLNIGLWFPNNWCGEPNFETDYAVVESFTYTPFEGETAGKVNTQTLKSGGFLDNVSIPEKNLYANGDFLYPISSVNGFSSEGENQINQGNLSLNGTLTQTVYSDLFGKSYTLKIDKTGDLTVKITYIDFVSDIVIGETLTYLDGNTFTLVAPDLATGIKIELISASCVINKVSLTLNL